MAEPWVTIALPSFNQAQYLDKALESVFQQDVGVEVFVLDGGSTDHSVDIIRRWEHRLSGWRSNRDEGQAAAINEGISLGTAPFVCWLNSDDWLLPGGLHRLLQELDCHRDAPAAYGRAWNYKQRTGVHRPVWVEPFSEKRLALRCIISQPATLIRRSSWNAVGGVDPRLHMVMDYDLWWKLYKLQGPLQFVDEFVAVNREHPETKTRTLRRRHYKEAIEVVQRYHGCVPLKWRIAQPYSVWYKGALNFFR